MAKSSKENWSKKLLAAVNEIDRPGAFCTHGIADPILPGLAVDGIRLIGLPLSNEQAPQRYAARMSLYAIAINPLLICPILMALSSRLH